MGVCLPIAAWAEACEWCDGCANWHLGFFGRVGDREIDRGCRHINDQVLLMLGSYGSRIAHEIHMGMDCCARRRWAGVGSGLHQTPSVLFT